MPVRLGEEPIGSLLFELYIPDVQLNFRAEASLRPPPKTDKLIFYRKKLMNVNNRHH